MEIYFLDSVDRLHSQRLFFNIFSRWLLVHDSRKKGCPRICYASLVLKQLIFMFFIKLSCFGSNLFF